MYDQEKDRRWLDPLLDRKWLRGLLLDRQPGRDFSELVIISGVVRATRRTMNLSADAVIGRVFDVAAELISRENARKL